MLTKKESIHIGIILLILTFSLSFLVPITKIIYVFGIVFSTIMINIFAKKIIAFHLDSKVEFKFWEIQKYGFKKTHEFKNPLPIGIFLPVLSSMLTFGHFTWLASLVFEVKPEIYKTAKRYGLYAFSELTEFQIGLIAAAGIIANLLFSIIAYLFGAPDLARLNIYYAFFNIIPLLDLDGNKIFFGSTVIWAILATITFIALNYAFFLV